MIRTCQAGDLPAIYEIINDAAQAYRGIIPADRWHEPYMPMEQLLDQGEVIGHVYKVSRRDNTSIAQDGSPGNP